MCNCCHYFIAMHIMIFQLPYNANELVYITSRLYQKWSQKTLNSKFFREGMPPDPLKTVVTMHYTSVNAFTNQTDHFNSTGYGPVISFWFTLVHSFKLTPAWTKCGLHSKLTYWVQKLRCGLSPVQSVLTSVPRKRVFHTNMHTNCVSSLLKWRVAVQLWDDVAGRLVAYVGSYHHAH